MIQEVSKSPRVALCRHCGGTGFVVTGKLFRKRETCPQCLGSGRVTVSCKMTLDIRPWPGSDGEAPSGSPRRGEGE